MCAGVSDRLRCEIASTKMTGRTLNDSTVADRLAVSPAEAARLAGVGRTTIYKTIRSGDLRSLKIGKRRLILIASIREWLETAQQAVDSAAQRRALAPDAEASEERVHARVGRLRKGWVVSPQADRSPCGDGG
jgi:excisionase family DNA binding protein